MKKETEIKNIGVTFQMLKDSDKLLFLDMAIGNIKDNRYLIGEVLKMAERVYHPMQDIETWIEGRFTKHPGYPPKRVINECVKANKLNRQMEPLLWGLARKIKKRVLRRIERRAVKNV